MTPLSGDVSPDATTSMPTLGPKLVMGANRVLSYGAKGGWATADAGNQGTKNDERD